jgi:Kef-type K+ transport system membrane component KefB
LCLEHAGFTSAIWPTAVPQAGGHAPYDSTITFTVIADVGVVLFMFLLGCELDHHRLNSEWRTAMPIALSAIVVPFGLGAASSVWLEVGTALMALLAAC